MRHAILNRKTLFIVGAGASEEASLPVGSDLKKRIAELLNITLDDYSTIESGDKLIISTLEICHRYASAPKADLGELIYAAHFIKDAMPQAISIDNFIDSHSDDNKIEFCGKLAIVRAILAAENASSLFIDGSNIYNRMDFSSLENTWYSKFMMLLTENCTRDELIERLKLIIFIVFNYDRCIEHFLFNAIQNYYGFTDHEAVQVLANLKIYHPYGVVGKLPWQIGDSVAFGAIPSPDKLIELVSQIRTFTEGTDSKSSEILSIRNEISEAEHIVFLGFAFHKLNMRLLKLSEDMKPQANTTYFASAHGISNSDLELIKSDIRDLKKTSDTGIFINNKLKCVDLFNEYWRGLSLA